MITSLSLSLSLYILAQHTGGLPELYSVYLKGNDVAQVAGYRKTLLGSCQALNLLDDRKVTVLERLKAVAWLEGGSEKEKQVYLCILHHHALSPEREREKERERERERESYNINIFIYLYIYNPE